MYTRGLSLSHSGETWTTIDGPNNPCMSGCALERGCQDLVSRMTLDTTVRIAFGVDLGCLAPSLPQVPAAKSYETASTCSFARFSRPFWKVERLLQIGQERDLKKAVAALDSYADEVIQKRKKELPEGKLMEQVNEVHGWASHILSHKES